MAAISASAAAGSQPDAAMTATAAARGMQVTFLAAAALAGLALALSVLAARGTRRHGGANGRPR
jgi:hypothetical protein